MRVRTGLGATALTLLVAGAAASAPPPVSLTAKLPGSVTAGRSFTVRLVVRKAARPPVTVSARKGLERVSFRARRVNGVRYAARMTLPTAGRWTLVVRAGKRSYRLGSLLARAPQPAAQPLELRNIGAMTTAPDGSLLVTEGGANRIARVDLATGAVATLAGSGAQGTSGDGGPAAQAAIGNPFGIAVSRAGDVYVTSDGRLRRIDPSGRISTVFVAPSDTGPITVDAQGSVFFATATRIYRVDAASGAVEVYAGTGVAGGGGDGGPAAAAQINVPHGLLIATDGALLVADTENNRVRRIDPLSRVITTVARGIAGGGMCHGPGGVPYVTDFSGQAVKRLETSGSTVIAGNGRLGSSGDGGPATQASIATPIGCAVDAAGNLYIAEGGDVSRIRRVDPAGTITTLSRGR